MRRTTYRQRDKVTMRALNRLMLAALLVASWQAAKAYPEDSPPLVTVGPLHGAHGAGAVDHGGGHGVAVGGAGSDAARGDLVGQLSG